MNKLALDIERAADVKLAAIQDYIKPALTGAGVATGLAAVPSILGAYADDENILKSLASTAQWTLPIGAMLGAGTVPAGELMQILTKKIPGQVDDIISRIPNKSDLLELSDSTIKNILDRLETPIKGAVNAGNEVKQTTIDIKDMLKGIGREATSIDYM